MYTSTILNMIDNVSSTALLALIDEDTDIMLLLKALHKKWVDTKETDIRFVNVMIYTFIKYPEQFNNFILNEIDSETVCRFINQLNSLVAKELSPDGFVFLDKYFSTNILNPLKILIEKYGRCLWAGTNYGIDKLLPASVLNQIEFNYADYDRIETARSIKDLKTILLKYKCGVWIIDNRVHVDFILPTIDLKFAPDDLIKLPEADTMFTDTNLETTVKLNMKFLLKNLLNVVLTIRFFVNGDFINGDNLRFTCKVDNQWNFIPDVSRKTKNKFKHININPDWFERYIIDQEELQEILSPKVIINKKNGSIFKQIKEVIK